MLRPDAQLTTAAEFAAHYTTLSLALVPIPNGQKNPNRADWQLPENAITNEAAALKRWGGAPLNMGLLHSVSHTATLDIDSEAWARVALESIGIDLDALVEANPYRIRGARGEKPVYRVPDGIALTRHALKWPPHPDAEPDPRTGKPIPFTVFELRSGSTQDVLPPSIHPDTLEPYAWVNGAPATREAIPFVPDELLDLWQNWGRIEPLLKSACEWNPAPLPQSKTRSVSDTTSNEQKPDVIGAFNDRYGIKEILERNNYTKRSETRYLAPSSSSGLAGVHILPGRDGGHAVAYSHHGSDPLSGQYPHDAFGAYTILEQGANVSDAVKAAAHLLGMEYSTDGTVTRGGVTLEGEVWPDPEPFTDALESVPHLEPALLPSTLRAYCQDYAQDLSVPLEFVAAPALGALGGFIGRRVGLRLKRHSEWTVYGNLYVTIIGPPSVGKSPVLEAAIRPVRAREAKARKSFVAQQQGDAVDKLMLESELGTLKSALKSNPNKAINGIEGEERKTRLRETLAKIAAIGATEPRMIVNDVTDARLVPILNENTNGVMFVRDEITAFLEQLERGEHFSRSLYLELWSGDAHHTVDRKGDGSSSNTVRVEGGCLGIIGGIQPSRLQKFLAESYSQGSSDGFFARFLPVWPDSFDVFKFSDRYADGNARKSVNALYEWLETVDFTTIGAQPYEDPFADDEDEKEKPAYFMLDDGAYELFKAFYTETMQRMRRDGFGDAEDEFTGKVGKQLGSIALALHLVRIQSGEVPHGPVGEETLLMAIGWLEFFAAHWKKIMSLAKSSSPTAMLSKRVKSGDVCDGMTVRDLIRKEWAGLRTPALVNKALGELESAGWVRLENASKGIRDSLVIRVNPKLEVKKGGGTDE